MSSFLTHVHFLSAHPQAPLVHWQSALAAIAPAECFLHRSLTKPPLVHYGVLPQGSQVWLKRSGSSPQRQNQWAYSSPGRDRKKLKM